eukprot:s1793_g15.t1
MQNGKQESFFSNKMENFLSDARKEEQERRRVAMEEAVRQAKLGTAARNASPEAPPVRSPVRSVTGGNSLPGHPAVNKAENILASHTHTLQIHIPKVSAMPVATEAAISKHPGQMQRVAMVPASQVLVEPARLTTTGLTSELRPHDLLRHRNSLYFWLDAAAVSGTAKAKASSDTNECGSRWSYASMVRWSAGFPREWHRICECPASS